MARQDVGQSRRGAERERDQSDEIGVLSEQRKQPAAALQAADELIERVERRVRISECANRSSRIGTSSVNCARANSLRNAG
jgi:hypothetical protein